MMHTGSKNFSIAFLDQYADMGGGQQVMLALLEAALSLKLRVSLYCPVGQLTQRAAHMGVRIVPIPELSLRKGKKRFVDMLSLAAYSFRFLWTQRTSLRGHDLIYVNGPRLCPAALLYSFLNRKMRFACHVHLLHNQTDTCLISLFLKRKACLGAALPSRFIEKRMHGNLPAVVAQKLHLVENGLGQAFSELNFVDRFSNASSFGVMIVGRICPEKGYNLLPGLARVFPQIAFHAIGKVWAEDAAWFEALRGDVSANLIFHGESTDIPRLVAELRPQFCLIPSQVDEAFGLAAIEGMALSCLTIVRQQGALAELAVGTGAWSFVKDEDVATLLGKGMALSKEALLAESRGQYQMVMTRYSHAAWAKRLRDWLRILTGQEEA